MAHEHLPYPSTLPTEDIVALVQAVRAGTLLSEPQLGVKVLWEVSGYAALMAVGEPDSGTPTGPAIHTSSAPCSQEQILEALENYADAQRESNPDVVQALNVPWAQVLKWALQLLGTLV